VPHIQEIHTYLNAICKANDVILVQTLPELLSSPRYLKLCKAHIYQNDSPLFKYDQPSSVMITDTSESELFILIFSRKIFTTSQSSLSVMHHPTGWPIIYTSKEIITCTVCIMHYHTIYHNQCIPAPKSSDTSNVINLNLYEFVSCVESIHTILEQN